MADNCRWQDANRGKKVPKGRDLSLSDLPQLGTVRNLGYGADGCERLQRLEFLTQCPSCGKRVEGWSDTEAWAEDYGEATGHDWGLVMQQRPTRWKHVEYGPAQAACCGLLL